MIEEMKGLIDKAASALIRTRNGRSERGWPLLDVLIQKAVEPGGMD